jgi:hypothetical protein
LKCILSKTKITAFKKGEKLKATDRCRMNEHNNEAAHQFNHLGSMLESTGSWNKQETLAKTNRYPGLADR